MKYIDTPFLLHGASGKMRDIVFYQKNGRTFARKAVEHCNVIPTQKQAQVRDKFKEANLFAKAVIADAELKAIYEKRAKGKRTAYAEAIMEFMKV